MKTGGILIEDIHACHVPAGHCAWWWLGQHGFVIKLGTTICWLDAYLTPHPSRQVAPLVGAEEVTGATLVLGTHDHGDHIDREAWPAMANASPGAKFIVPKLLREKIACEIGLPEQRVLAIDEGISIQLDEVTVTAVPAAHEFLDVDPATGLHPYLGYIIEGSGFRLYHAGDTCLYEGRQAGLRRWSLDLALLPINGRNAKRLAANCIGNMTYQEAVDLAGAIRPGLTVPTHFDMFATNREDPQLFLDYMRIKYPHLATCLPRHGQGNITANSRPERNLACSAPNSTE